MADCGSSTQWAPQVRAFIQIIGKRSAPFSQALWTTDYGPRPDALQLPDAPLRSLQRVPPSPNAH